MSRLHLVGLNHRTAPVEVRERLAVSDARGVHALEYVTAVPGVQEAVVLSTCNRVEIYLWGDEGAGERVFEAMVGPHSAPHREGGELASHLYLRSGDEAVAHLFRVASGLDSLMLGEAEILGQVKGSLERATRVGASGPHLDELFRRAIGCGKRARHETAIGRGALSVGAAAVELARQVFGSLAGHTVLILGAGEMSARVASCLVSSGARRVIVANRTFERAVEIARGFDDEGAGALAVTWDEFPAHFAAADIVISSTRAPHYVVTPEHVQSTARARRRSLLLIDIAVPRDIDPGCNRFDDVFLFDIDDLHGVVEANRTEREREIEPVEAIIAQECALWSRWICGQSAAPVRSALARRAGELRDREVQTALARLGHLSDRDRAVVTGLAHALSQKLMHAPLAHLGNGGAADASVLARAFGLPETAATVTGDSFASVAATDPDDSGPIRASDFIVAPWNAQPDSAPVSSTDDSVRPAADVGYGSDIAFSRNVLSSRGGAAR